MTGALLDLNELSALAEVPVERLRHYAEAGLLPPARRAGDRLGFPAVEAHTMRLVAGVERLGIVGDDLIGLADTWRNGDCGEAQRRLAGAVTARLSTVQDGLTAQQQRATQHGPGTPGWVEATTASVPLAENAARLQAALAALPATPHTGPCDDVCACTAAVTAPGDVYRFPTNPAAADPALMCDLAADGGDAVDRIEVWQQVFTRVLARDQLSDTETGLALRFPLDADLAATLARLAAAEYKCCSFGSYTIVIDHTGLRLEVRMPDGASEMLAAVLGLPDPTAPPTREAHGAPDQS
jgi:DNA-binding transcriptional MerR regulator